MRKQFAQHLLSEMYTNPDIYLITGDLGYGLWDSVRTEFPNRFYNVGSSEMVMMGSAIGLAMDGKIPFVYSITPFAIYRPFEMIRNYLNHERIAVNILGGGRDMDYGYLGFSHWATEDVKVISLFEHIRTFKPNTEDELDVAFRFSVDNKVPTYINLRK